MFKFLFIAPLAAFLVAGSARAAPLQTLTLRTEPQASDRGLRAEIIEVQSHRTPVAIIATDALYGGVAGLAIGAGVALLEGGNNWTRDLMVGAGAGLLVGGLLGALDASAYLDRPYGRGFNRAVGLGSGF